MGSDRELRSEFRRALDDALPPAPWLEAVITDALRRRERERWIDRVRRRRTPMRLAIGLTMVALAVALATVLLLAQMYLPRPIPAGHSMLTPAEQSQLAQLEARPLNIPLVPANGECPTTPRTIVHPWSNPTDSAFRSGTGPVYLPEGGVPVDGGRYSDVIYYMDPTVKGVVLIRARYLDDGTPVSFTGAWAAGPYVGTDTVEGKHVVFHAEVAFPADRPPANPLAGAGWGLWPVRQTPLHGRRCVAFQIDTATGTQVLVVSR